MNTTGGPGITPEDLPLLKEGLVDLLGAVLLIFAVGFGLAPVFILGLRKSKGAAAVAGIIAVVLLVISLGLFLAF